jgi:membrane fusion protein (multidrug efflux system)
LIGDKADGNSISKKHKLRSSPLEVDQIMEKQEKKYGRRWVKKRHVGTLLVLLVVLGGLCMWYRSKALVETDDAFVESHVHVISPRVAGHVLRVLVKDNQRVGKGDLLVELDPAEYQAQVDRAAAVLALAENETSGDHAAVDQARAGVGQVRAVLEQAELDLQRGEALLAREVMPKEQVDRLRTAVRVASARLQESREALKRARAVIGQSARGGEARIAQRRAELAAARLDLNYTRIIAPADGYVTRKNVELGNNVRAGQPLLALVELEQPWIVANFKEGQLAHVQSGQKVEFTVDAFPGRSFSGRVDSIMAGTGAAFSLLPPENATGNYVKVVQRIPVKIAIERESDPQHLLRVGMSVVPTIHTGLRLGEALAGLNPFAD